MSQIGTFLFGGAGNVVATIIQADSGTAMANNDNTLYGLGGPNINSSATGNTITVNLDDDINVTSIAHSDITFINKTISSTSNIILSSSGGEIYVSDSGIDENAFTYLDSSKAFRTRSATIAGSTLIGRTGNSPISNTITAGSNISITNAPGSITISRSGMAAGSAVNWTYLDFNVLGAPYTQTMEANNGYIVYWLGGGYGNIKLTLKFPSTMNVGDFFIINVLQGAGQNSLQAGTYNIEIDPGSQYAIQAPYQTQEFITSKIHFYLTTYNGGSSPAKNVTFLCTQKNDPRAPQSRTTLSVINVQGTLVY